MNIGTVIGVISFVATFFGITWKVKTDQNELRQEVETRLTKIETEMQWIVSQQRERNKVYQNHYMKEHEHKQEETNDAERDTKAS